MQLNDAEFRAGLDGLVAKGVVTIAGDVVSITPRGYETIAREAGWAPGWDADDVPCFVHLSGGRPCSYVTSWEELCRQQRLVTLGSLM